MEDVTFTLKASNEKRPKCLGVGPSSVSRSPAHLSPAHLGRAVFTSHTSSARAASWCVHPSRPLRPRGAGGTVSKPRPYSAIVLVGVSMSPPWREGRRSSVAGAGRGFIAGLRPPLRPLLRRPPLPCRRLLILQTPAGARLLPSGPLPQPQSALTGPQRGDASCFWLRTPLSGLQFRSIRG